MSFYVTSFYRFVSPAWTSERVTLLEKTLVEFGRKMKLKGLVLLGPEGINATISGSKSAVATAKQLIRTEFAQELNAATRTDSDGAAGEILFKDSEWKETPFLKWKVQIRDEIVTMGAPGLAPMNSRNRHLSPEEFHKELNDAVVLDTRNSFEVSVGKFKNAVDFEMKDFAQFPEKLKSSGLRKDQKIL
ncbi:MAG: hypothetical protein ABL958_11285, partial [Bdellovibrionia bacterium]